jgi:hypothetical protein
VVRHSRQSRQVDVPTQRSAGGKPDLTACAVPTPSAEAET